MIYDRRVLHSLAALALAVCGFAAEPARAAWPERNVTLVVPFAAGGITDILARLTAERLKDKLGQTFIVENESGAAGIVAAARVARAEADGYTLFFGTISQLTIAPFTHNIPYDPIKDYTPIAIVATSPFAITVGVAMPVKTLAEFMAQVKAHQGQIPFGSAGAGSVTHLSVAVFLKTTGLEMAHVPYRGVGPAFQDLLAGHIAMMAPSPVELKPFIGDSRVRPLAITGAKRLKALPDVPTISETIPMPAVVTWNGVLAPSHTPQPVIAKLAAELAAAAKDTEFLAKLDKIGVDPSDAGPEAFAKIIAADTDRWRGIVKELGLRVQQ